MSLTILCLASYEKGHAFLRQAKQSGCRVLLLTSLSLQGVAHWPEGAIDDTFYMPDQDKVWDREQTIRAVSYLARTTPIDRIVPLDDFDLEMAAALREHLRLAGMGESATRYFRDKLAMRRKAQSAGLPIPEFVHILNHDRVNQFMAAVPGPWVLKPRLMAGAIGIRKVRTPQELWEHVNALGDDQSYYLLERFVPGSICHVDSAVYEGEVVWAVASRYGKPPLEVSHAGDVFTTALLERASELNQALLAMNRKVLAALGLRRGVSHTEFIAADDGGIYFLETSARVGGAHIADLIDHATGVNLWAEWAKIEIAGGEAPYTPPPARPDYGGLLVSLAKQQTPDTSAYHDPEIVWRMTGKDHHVGFIVKHPDYTHVQHKLQDLAARVRQDFWAYAPPKSKPTE